MNVWTCIVTHQTSKPIVNFHSTVERFQAAVLTTTILTNMATVRCCETRAVLMVFDMDSNKFSNYVSVCQAVRGTTQKFPKLQCRAKTACSAAVCH